MIRLALALPMMYKFTPTALLTTVVRDVGNAVHILLHTATTTTTTTCKEVIHKLSITTYVVINSLYKLLQSNYCTLLYITSLFICHNWIHKLRTITTTTTTRTIFFTTNFPTTTATSY